MALATGSIFHQSATATTGNVNGSGFNPANANMLTDLTTNANTANTASPVVSSASYNFVAGDVGNWLYIQSGTNWIVGWYQIASVGSNKATLTAGIGTAQIISLGFKAPSTVIGCASVGTPTGGVFTIDYSQTDTAKVNAIADFNAVGASTTLTSATAGFAPVMVGNFFHQTTTGTGGFGVVGWYEIVTYINVTTITTDSSVNNGTTSVNTTGYVGGAGRLNALEDAYGEMLPSGAHVWIKNGTYAFTGTVSIASANGTQASPIFWLGFNAIPGDDPRGSTRPTFALGAFGLTVGQYHNYCNIIFTGTSGTMVLTNNATMVLRYCKLLNTSTTANRVALNTGSQTHYFCELISQNGYAMTATNPRMIGCYFHDSQHALNSGSNNGHYINCIFASCDVAAITSTSASGLIAMDGNTFYGRASTPRGIGINFTVAGLSNRMLNNIFSGLATGVLFTTTSSLSNMGGYNDYYNNTADVSLHTKDKTDIAVDPQFANISEVIPAASSTTTGSTLTDTSKNFTTLGVVVNQDFLHVISGPTAGVYLITAISTTTNPNDTLTVNNALGSYSGGAFSGYIPTGHDYSVGTNLRAQGFPGLFAGSATTQYLDIGGVQRQEAFSFTFGS